GRGAQLRRDPHRWRGEAARLGDGARPAARRAALGGGVPSRPVPRRVPRPAYGSSPEEGRRRGGDGSRPDREARGGHRPHGGAQEEPRGAEGRRRGTGGGTRARRETAAGGRRPAAPRAGGRAAGTPGGGERPA